MAAAVCGRLLNNLSSTYKHVTGLNYYPIGFLQTRNYAARKGTREKARKKKIKVVVEKVGFIPHNQRDKMVEFKKKKIDLNKIILDDSKKPDRPKDDVLIEKLYKWKIYSFEEAVQCHRETHHPTMYNLPNAQIKALIELDLQSPKKGKTLDTFSQIANMPNSFAHDQHRKVVVFCNDPEMREVAKQTGAHLTGDKDLIKQVQSGQISLKEYDIIIAEPSILPDLLLIKGLIKTKFPSAKAGTLSTDVKAAVSKFLSGIKYTAKPHEYLKTYGTIDVAFGTIDMDTKQLEENLISLIKDVNDAKPRRSGSFITRIRIKCPPSHELFKIDFEKYLSTDAPTKEKEELEEDEEDDMHIIASN
ncbi:39S ribosomal protein L1, mitochondrial [Pseudomyrmex gracilis]|uniref:39S ribosomal protein L1, mitochondrial n=1 Tax=Pseudomyrmex gracilis TaxID=219809 RepID=UPI0009959EC7|nr:39S ribosomal protein L1, mitochondrial [Pseudomyrmex gracilis]